MTSAFCSPSLSWRPYQLNLPRMSGLPGGCLAVRLNCGSCPQWSHVTLGIVRLHRASGTISVHSHSHRARRHRRLAIVGRLEVRIELLNSAIDPVDSHQLLLHNVGGLLLSVPTPTGAISGRTCHCIALGAGRRREWPLYGLSLWTATLESAIYAGDSSQCPPPDLVRGLLRLVLLLVVGILVVMVVRLLAEEPLDELALDLLLAD